MLSLGCHACARVFAGQQSGNMFIALGEKDIEDQVTLQAQWL
jgi:hypothetical protein